MYKTYSLKNTNIGLDGNTGETTLFGLSKFILDKWLTGKVPLSSCYILHSIRVIWGAKAEQELQKMYPNIKKQLAMGPDFVPMTGLCFLVYNKLLELFYNYPEECIHFIETSGFILDYQ